LRPYGPLHYALALVSLGATVLTFLASFQCKFFNASYGLAKYEAINPLFATHRGVGIWNIDKDGRCEAWPDDDDDVNTFMLTARIMSIVACIFAVLFGSMVFIPFCFNVGGNAYMKKVSQCFLIMAPITASLFVSQAIFLLGVIVFYRPSRSTRTVIIEYNLWTETHSI
jgi:hypothetical protein